MMRSTFAGFTTGQLAMAASQRAIDVTGQNISNINTEGYTQQRLDIASLNLRNGSFYNSSNRIRVGYGVDMTGISQLRDPFLDAQYRSQIYKLGTTDAQAAGLEKLQVPFDEAATSGVRDAFLQLSNALQTLSKDDGYTKENDTVVRSRMQILVNLFREKATTLQDIRKDTQDSFKATDIKDLNETLKNIANLNTTIKNSQILGNPALELMDQRNMLLDELASYLPIDVQYSQKPIGEGYSVQVLDVVFKDTESKKHDLISDGRYGQFYADITRAPNGEGPVTLSLTDAEGRTSTLAKQKQEIEGDYLVYRKADGTSSVYEKNGQYYEKGAGGAFTLLTPQPNKKDLIPVTYYTNDSTIGGGTLKGSLDFMNKSGDFDDPTTDFKGIGYYEKVLDSLVGTFVEAFNEANKGIKVDEATGMPVVKGPKQERNSDGYLVFKDNNTPANEVYGDDKGNYYTKTGSTYTPITPTTGTLTPVIEQQQKKNDDGYLVFTDAANAEVYQDVNGKYYSKNGADYVLMDPAPDPATLTEVMEDVKEYEYEDRPLFEKIDPTKGYTADNIKIASKWMTGEHRITNTNNIVNGKIGSSGNENILNMIDMLSKNYDFEVTNAKTDATTTFYKGSFFSCFANIESSLAIDISSAAVMLDNQITVLNQTSNSRDGVSGVQLDEEGMNLLHYNQSYSAAARLITTLDEMLDKLINGTGVVGR